MDADVLREQLAAAREELRLQNEANDMIAKERDAFKQARDEARLLFNKEYNEANESRRRLREQINTLTEDLVATRYERDVARSDLAAARALLRERGVADRDLRDRIDAARAGVER